LDAGGQPRPESRGGCDDHVAATIRVWAHGRPTDLRKGSNGLVGIVKKELREDRLNGDLFLFVSRRRTGCKVLLWTARAFRSS
jgi:hypothetical protein